MPSFGAIPHRKFVLCGGDSKRSDHHGGQRISKLALEHRAFACHHAVMFRHFIGQKRRKNIRQVYLFRTLKISGRALEVLRHHAELNPLRAQNMADLPQHFRDAHIRAHIAGPVISRKKQLEFFARLPVLAFSHHPA